MPKLDRQGRITIPFDLRQKVNLTVPKEIAICYDFQNEAISICDSSDIVDKYVISFRKLDSKGTLFLPTEALNLLEINKDDTFIVFVKNNELFIASLY